VKTTPGVATRLIGAGLLIAAGAVHLDLYLTGYRSIPTIGPLFLLQVVAALLVGVAILATVRMSGHVIGRLAALAGALLAIGTLAGYLVSLHVGLFGFHEVRTTAGVVAGILELLAAAALGFAALGTSSTHARHDRITGILVIAALAVLFVVAEVTVSAPRAGPHQTSTSGARGTSVLLIKIQNFTFHPADPVASPGERIKIVNEDPVAHTFTATGPGGFNSGSIAPHASKVVVAPKKTGHFSFYCLIHQYMTGTLTVRS
jgi:plastocyanin